jgi:hypothetical protein
MMESQVAVSSNPFSTRYVRPSAVPYVFPDGVDVQQLLATLEDRVWWGQIIGPHGSGKSTLLHTLIPHVEGAGRRVAFHTLRQGQGRLEVSGAEISTWDTNTQVVVDGYEQLNWLCRIWLRRACRKRRAGLLVTAHQPVGLPTLWTTPTSARLARRIVAGVLGEAPNVHIAEDEIDQLLEANRGDVRELLMALYDVYEQRTPDAGRM